MENGLDGWAQRVVINSLKWLIMSSVIPRGLCQASTLCILSSDSDDRGGLCLHKICGRNSCACWRAELLFRGLKIWKWPDMDFRKLGKVKTKVLCWKRTIHSHSTGGRYTSSSAEQELLCKRHQRNLVAMR